MFVWRNLVVGNRKINAVLVKSNFSNYEKLLNSKLLECEMGGSHFGFVQIFFVTGDK